MIYVITQLYVLLMGINFSVKGISLKSIFERHYMFFSFLVALVLCFGYMTGSDWTWYEYIYNEASLTNLASYRDEPAFYFLMLLFKQLGFGYFGFSILMKLIHFFVVAWLLKKLSHNYYFALFVYIAHYGLFMFVDNPLRYMIAMNFAYLALGYMFEGKKTLPFLLSIISILFHYTMIVFIPIMIFLRMKWNFKFILIIAISSLLLNGIAIAKVLSLFPASLEFYLGYVLKIDQYNTILTLGTIANILQIIFLLVYRLEVEDKKKSFFLNTLYAYMILFNLSLVIPVFFRFMIMLAPVYCAFLSYLAYSILSLNSSAIRKVIAAYIIFFAIYATVDTVTSKYAYLPYTNYLINNLTGDVYEYGYRSTYNHRYFQEGVLIY